MRYSVLFLFLLLTLNLSAQWRIKYNGDDGDNEVKSASFISPTTGFIATQKWIGFTTDSGQTFQRRYVTIGNVNYNNNPVNLTFGFTVEDIHAFSTDTLLVSGDYGFEPSILYSTNGGVSWLLVYYRGIPFNTVNVVNSMWQMEFPGQGSIGYAVHGDQVLKTTNRGQSWQVARQDDNRELFDISFVNTQTGFAAGPNRLLKTTNGGTSWTVLTVPFSIKELFAFSDQYVFINTSNGDNFYTANGGTSWTQANAPISQIYAEDLYYVNDSTGYIAEGAIYQTRNRGKSWELMPGTENLTGIYKLCFWNSQLAWACAYAEDLYITTNGGGVSHPVALFTVDASSVCVNNTIQLINQSHSGYTYQWFRNNVLYATTYHASYTAGSAPENIKLVVSNGTETDTLVEYVDAVASSAIVINAAARYDTVCSGSAAVFDIFNSRPDLQYKVGRSCCGFSSPVNGNGGTLTLSINTLSSEDSNSTFRITAGAYGSCGYLLDTVWRTVRILRSDPPVTTAIDTVCTQAPFMITITNSKVGYSYWADQTFPKVNGNGGMIQVPCQVGLATFTTIIDPNGDNSLISYRFNIYSRHISTGCGGLTPVASAITIGRRSISNFDIHGYEWMTGDNLKFINKSKRGETWIWRFPDGGNSPTSPMAEPNNINYTLGGPKLVKLIAITHEGCRDSSTRAIEVYAGTGAVAPENTCPGTVGNVVDSLRGNRQYYVSRSIYEDEYGNRIIGGGYTDMSFPYGFYPTGYEGWFAAKFDVNGQLKWSVRQSTGDDYSTYNQNSHIIVEQVIGDSLNYTYLFGHSFNRTRITTNGVDIFPIPRNGSFLIRISPTGTIVWVKTFYNRQAFTDGTLPDYSGGSILRGKGDDIYVLTHRHPGGRFFMDNTQLYGYNEGVTGVIIQMDKDGNIKRKRTYPILVNNMRRFEIYTTNSYDSLAKAKWGPGGNIVVYGLLNPTEMTGNTIDGVTVPFNTTSIKSALLFFDTASLNVISIRPLYRNTTSGPVSIPLETFAVDQNGNYFASFSHNLSPIPQSSLAYQGDLTKPKSIICGFDATGILTWTKQTEGLQPKSMEFAAGQLKVAGTNYTYSGFSNGAMNYYSNQSPTTSFVNKLTVIGDTNSYSGAGKYGLGSLDLTVASFDPSNGTVLKLSHYGSAKEDESAIMSKGYGDQMWLVGTVGTSIRNVLNVTDTTTTIFTYKIAADNNCTSSSSFLDFNLGQTTTQCIDSTYKLSWTSNGVALVNLSFSLNNGNTYTSIASSVPATLGEYVFNAVQAGALGPVLFKIQNSANALSDTASRTIVLKVTPDVTITASATTVCAGNTTVNFTATPVNGGSTPTYQWFVNNQAAGSNSPNFSLSSITNGMQIKVVMTSNYVCLTTPRDTSNIIAITVVAAITPGVSISGNTIVTQGQATLITAVPVNGGSAPVYQWQDSTTAHGWQNISGANLSTYNYSPAATGDKIRCNMTTNATCASPATVVSATLTFTVNAVTSVGSSPASEFGIHLYPNPSITSFTIDTLKLSHRWETLEVISMDGKHQLIHMLIVNKQRVDVDTRKLPAAMYLVVLRRKNGSPVYIKFVKQ